MTMKLNALLLGVALAALSAGAAAAGDDPALEATEEGLTLSLLDGDFAATLGGRAHYDVIQYDDGVVDDRFSGWRRARLELGVRIGDRLRLRADREFTNGGGWRNLWASFDVTDNLTLKGGNFIAPFSLEDLQSSNEMMFMERSLSNALSPGYGVGGQVSYSGDNWSVAGGWFGEAIDADEDGRPKDRGEGFTARAVFRPVESRKRILHLGAGVDSRQFGQGDITSVSAQPEVAFAPNLLRTGPISDVDSSLSVGGEFVFIDDNRMVQAQYIRSTMDRRVGGDFTADGFYIQGGWVVTGERYDYSQGSGVVRGVKARKRRPGVELTARYDQLDLGDGLIQGGFGRNYTLGANVYLTRNARFMVNYVHAEARDVSGRPDRDADIVAGRLQVNF